MSAFTCRPVLGLMIRSSHIAGFNPMMTPPATCEAQHRALTTRPQSCTATIFLQRTTPVSVSTVTSAICTPQTPLFDRPGDQLPLTDTVSMPSRAQASFQAHDLLLALSTTLP